MFSSAKMRACFPPRFLQTSAFSSRLIRNPSTGGTTGSTSTFRRCADGAIRSWKGVRWSRACLASSIGPRKQHVPPPVPTPRRRPILYGDLRNRLDRVSRQLSRRRAAAGLSRLSESAGARKLRAGGTRTLVAILAASFGFPGIFGPHQFARAYLPRRPYLGALRPCQRRLWHPGRRHRFHHSLCRFAESQVRKAVPQRESARLAGSNSTRAPRSGPQRAAALFPRVDRRRCRPAPERSGG